MRLRCRTCGKSNPTLFNRDGAFCDQACYWEWKSRKTIGLREPERHSGERHED